MVNNFHIDVTRVVPDLLHQSHDLFFYALKLLGTVQCPKVLLVRLERFYRLFALRWRGFVVKLGEALAGLFRQGLEVSSVAGIG